MNAELSQKAAQLMMMFFSIGVTLDERDRFVLAVQAAESEEDLPAWAKDLMRRAEAAREELLRDES
jgi:hypothetical protein